MFWPVLLPQVADRKPRYMLSMFYTQHDIQLLLSSVHLDIYDNQGAVQQIRR